MFEQRDRATAVVMYSLAIVAGPTLAPIIGAAVSEDPSLTWRWTMSVPSCARSRRQLTVESRYLVVIYTGVIVSSPSEGARGNIAERVGTALLRPRLPPRDLRRADPPSRSSLLLSSRALIDEDVKVKARDLRLRTGRWALHSRLDMQDTSLAKFMEQNLLRPIKMTFTEPILAAIITYNGFAYGTLCPHLSARARERGG